MNSKIMRSLQVLTQELATLKTTLTAAVPLPNPAQDVQWLHSKMMFDDEVKAFLTTFKRTTQHEH